MVGTGFWPSILSPVFWAGLSQITRVWTLELQSVMGDFIKLSGSTKSHLMAPKFNNMWQHVRVDYITADNAQEMVKLGRLLDVGKTAEPRWTSTSSAWQENEWLRRSPP